jgi:hypothetical protein
MGILELGIVMYQKTTVVHDAREAARLAAVNDPAGLTLPGNAPAGSTLSFSCAYIPGSGNQGNGYNVGDRVTARVDYAHQAIIPLIGDIIGNSVDLTSTATMRLEAEPTSFC